MKKNLFLSATLFFFCVLSMNAQISVLTEGFDNYAGTTGTVPVGWYIGWNSNAVPNSSFYTTAGNFGLSSPSYKFGITADTIISPAFVNADSLSFWLKGNGVPFSPSNVLEILESPDSVVWNQIAFLDSMPSAGTAFTMAVPTTSTHLMFIYTKVSGNLAIDDIHVTRNITISIPNLSLSNSRYDINVYPIPAIHDIYIDINSGIAEVLSVEMFNLDGEKIMNIPASKNFTNHFSFDVSSVSAGVCFLKITFDNGVVTRKIIR